MNKLQLKAWYDELNDRLKSDLRKRFEKEFKLGEQGFYSQFKAKSLALERAILFADFFSKHIIHCHVTDLYRLPMEVIREHDERKKNSVENKSNETFGKSQSTLKKHKLVLK